MSSQFEEISLLGEGGFGEVWRVRGILDRKEYALKKIRFRSGDLNDTLKEVLAFTRLDAHLNIVGYYHSYLIEDDEEEEEEEVDINDDDDIGIDSATSGSGKSTNSWFNTQPPAVGGTDSTISNNSTTTRRTDGRGTDNDSYSQSRSVQKYSILVIKMELCDQSLRQWLNRRQPHAGTTLATILHMFFQITVALKFIHYRAGFIHRDLKPENILLKKRGAYQCVKIGDFGLVSLHGSGTGEPPGLHTSSIGTPPYAAPEIMESIELGKRTGQTMYGAKVDVYSMGIIFLELLFPFETRSEFADICEGLKEEGSFPMSFTTAHAEEQKKILEMLKPARPAPDSRPTSKKIHIWMKKFRRQTQPRCICHPMSI